jgi:hypothetical protein
MPLVTRMFASSEQAWDPMASSGVNVCRKTRTVLQKRALGLACVMVVTRGHVCARVRACVCEKGESADTLDWPDGVVFVGRE